MGLSSNKSPANVGEISLANNKSFNSQCSPVGSIGSTPQATAAVTTLFNDKSSPINKSSPLNKSFKKQVISNTNSATLTKAPLVNKPIINNNNMTLSKPKPQPQNN